MGPPGPGQGPAGEQSQGDRPLSITRMKGCQWPAGYSSYSHVSKACGGPRMPPCPPLLSGSVLFAGSVPDPFLPKSLCPLPQAFGIILPLLSSVSLLTFTEGFREAVWQRALPPLPCVPSPGPTGDLYGHGFSWEVLLLRILELEACPNSNPSFIHIHLLICQPALLCLVRARYCAHLSVCFSLHFTNSYEGHFILLGQGVGE